MPITEDIYNGIHKQHRIKENKCRRNLKMSAVLCGRADFLQLCQLQVVFDFSVFPLQPHLPFLFVFASWTSFSSLYPSFSIGCYLLFPFLWHLYPNSHLQYSQTFMTIIKIKHNQLQKRKKERKKPQAAFTHLPWLCSWSAGAVRLCCSFVYFSQCKLFIERRGSPCG